MGIALARLRRREYVYSPLMAEGVPTAYEPLNSFYHRRRDPSCDSLNGEFDYSQTCDTPC